MELALDYEKEKWELKAKVTSFFNSSRVSLLIITFGKRNKNSRSSKNQNNEKQTNLDQSEFNSDDENLYRISAKRRN